MYGEHLTILLVEDDQEYARLVPVVLKRAGFKFEIEHVVTLKNAIRQIEQRATGSDKAFDAVLLDLTLPDASGLDTFLRLQAAARDIPIVVLSGVDDKNLAINAVKTGAQDYLVKGQADMQWLGHSIRYAIERQSAQTEQSRHITRLALLRDVDDELTRRLDLEYVLMMGMDAALRLSAASAGLIGLIEDGRMTMTQNINFTPDMYEGIPILKTGIIGRALRNRRAELIPDVTVDSDYIQFNEKTQAQIVVPLLSQDRLVGILNLETNNPSWFTAEAFEFIKLLGARIAAAADNALLYKTSQNQLAELQVLYAQVSSLEQLKTDMIRIATHDLRTPLSNIMGYVYLLKRSFEGALPQQCMSYVGFIEESADRMQTIISDILSLERLESLQSIDTQQVALHDLAHRVFLDNQDQARQKGVKFQLEVPTNPVVIQGEPSLLYEAVTNLVGNAMKYTPEGGKIVLRVMSTSRRARLEVEDDGYGIPVDQQPRLFQPFFRVTTKETVGIAGTGLGLHLVKNIIERHDGEMVFRSEYGKGSLFGFWIPMHENREDKK